MSSVYSLFFLVLTTHLFLLVNAIYQTTYTISRAMNGLNPVPIALSFAVSAMIIATVGVAIATPLQYAFPVVAQVLPAIGAILLFYYAFEAYKLAKSPCVCETGKIDGKTIGAIFVMNLTSPHMLSDIALISGFYNSFHDDFNMVTLSIILVSAFSLSAFIWFGGIGLVAYKMGIKLQFARLHKFLHWLSVVMLVIIALTILTEAYTDLHIFEIFGDHEHEYGDAHGHETEHAHDDHDTDTDHKQQSHTHK